MEVTCVRFTQQTNCVTQEIFLILSTVLITIMSLLTEFQGKVILIKHISTKLSIAYTVCWLNTVDVKFYKERKTFAYFYHQGEIWHC